MPPKHSLHRVHNPPLPLTEKERGVLEFLELQFSVTGLAPSYQEIAEHFGFASINSVQNYLKQLTQKGYIHIPPHQKRAIQLLHPAASVQTHVQKLVEKNRKQQQRGLPIAPPARRASEVGRAASILEALQIPLLGSVAAGRPIEALKHDEFVEAPPSLIRNADKTFALTVAGQSMIEDGIHDGDVIFVQKQSTARNGEVVVASIDGESTVKRFYLRPHPDSGSRGSEKKMVELRPANSSMKSMWVDPTQVEIQGVLVGLLRKFQ